MREINNTINDEHCELMQFLLEVGEGEKWYLLRYNKWYYCLNRTFLSYLVWISDGKKNMLN